MLCCITEKASCCRQVIPVIQLFSVAFQLFILVFCFTSMDFDNVLYSISNSVETKLGLGFEINKLLELKDLFRFCKNTAFCLVGPSENEDDEIYHSSPSSSSSWSLSPLPSWPSSSPRQRWQYLPASLSKDFSFHKGVWILLILLPCQDGRDGGDFGGNILGRKSN